MKFKITLTLSKVLGFIIVIIGSIYALINSDSNVLTESFFYATLLVTTKTIVQDIDFTDIFKNRKKNNKQKK